MESRAVRCVYLSVVQDERVQGETHLCGSPTTRWVPARQSPAMEGYDSQRERKNVARHSSPAPGEGRPRACPDGGLLGPLVMLSPENQRTGEEGNGPSGMSHCGAMRAAPAGMPAQGTLGASRNQRSTGASLLRLLPSEDQPPRSPP